MKTTSLIAYAPTNSEINEDERMLFMIGSKPPGGGNQVLIVSCKRDHDLGLWQLDPVTGNTHSEPSRFLTDRQSSLIDTVFLRRSGTIPTMASLAIDLLSFNKDDVRLELLHKTRSGCVYAVASILEAELSEAYTEICLEAVDSFRNPPQELFTLVCEEEAQIVY